MLIVITLGQRKTNNINQMILLFELPFPISCRKIRLAKTNNHGLYYPTDNNIYDLIKRHFL